MVREDKLFMANFVVILGVLVALAIAIFFIAISLQKPEPLDVAAVLERIKPIGQAVIADAQAASTAAGSAPSAAASGASAAPAQQTDPGLAQGKEIYDTACMVCHASGVAGAPKYGDQAAWAERMQKGLDQVYQTAIAGKGGMPPKGGRVDLTDDAFKKAVDYLLAGAGQGASSAPAPAASTTAPSAVMPSIPAPSAPSTAAPVAATTPASAPPPPASPAPATTAGVATPQAVQQTQTPPASVGTAPQAAPAAPADEAGLAEGKEIYSGVCVTCHDSGVAGAPKLGDKAAWAERLKKGIDQVYQTAITGKGGMPPKGGRVDLSDENFKRAVDYMVKSAQ